MDIDKDRLKELSDLFAEAEAKVKEVEEIDKVPASLVGVPSAKGLKPGYRDESRNFP